MKKTGDVFSLRSRVAVITGGAGLLGREHASALAGAGARVVLTDIDGDKAQAAAARLEKRWPGRFWGLTMDVTSVGSVAAGRDAILRKFKRIDILINNASVDAKVKRSGGVEGSRLEHFPLGRWDFEMGVGLTGAFLCAQAFGPALAKRSGGVILNIASDLSVISPDQRLYEQPGRAPGDQPVKPVTYSVVKTGLIGLTRYLATYWAPAIRVNALSPGGVWAGQPRAFVEKLSERIPLGRMARPEEYRGAVVFLCSDASSYMTGQNIVMDGGRSVW